MGKVLEGAMELKLLLLEQFTESGPELSPFFYHQWCYMLWLRNFSVDFSG